MWSHFTTNFVRFVSAICFSVTSEVLWDTSTIGTFPFSCYITVWKTYTKLKNLIVLHKNQSECHQSWVSILPQSNSSLSSTQSYSRSHLDSASTHFLSLHWNWTSVHPILNKNIFLKIFILLLYEYLYAYRENV